MNDKKLVKNYIYNAIYQLFVIIIPIILTPYLARTLGSEGSGRYSYLYSIVTYFVLFASLGFGYYAQRLVASHKSDKHQQSVDFWEIIIVRLIPSIITLILFYFMVYSNLVGKDNLYVLLCFSIQIIAIPFDISFYFQGNEEFKKLVFRNLVIRILSIVSIFLFVKKSDDLWLYTLIISLTNLISNLSLWPVVFKLERVSLKELKPIKHLKSSFILFLPTIATSIYTSLDKTLIGIITQSDSENGNYEYAERIVRMALTVVTAMGTAMSPRNSKMMSEGKIDDVVANIYSSSRFVFFLGVPIAFGLAAISDNMVPWFLGPDYTKASNLIKILSPIVLIIGMSNVFGLQFLIPCKKDNKFTISIVCGAVVNFVLNLVLIYFFQSYGAAISTVIAEIVVTFVMYLYVSKHISFLKILSFVWKYFVSGIIMFGVCYLLSFVLIPSLINSLIVVLIGAFVYFVLLVLFKDFYIKKTLNLIKKRKKNDSVS